MGSSPQSQLARRASPQRRRKLKYDSYILLLALVIVLPSTVAAEILLLIGSYSVELKWTITLVLLIGWLVGGSILQGNVIRPLQTLANMVASIREEDFSFRVRGGSRDDSLSDLTLELNNLADCMQQQKVSALEATALLKKVLMEIDVAVFTFDQQQQLRIVNRAGEQLMGRIAPRILGLTAHELGLSHYLDSPSPQVVEATFPGKHGRWAVSHTAFRENGVPHELLIISDM